jgi:hypothetical protein
MAKITKVQIASEASFLRGWAKGKPIQKAAPGATFWTCGKWSTKIPQDLVIAMVTAGLATKLREGPVDWKKPPSDVSIIMGAAPRPDVIGITAIQMI